MSESILQKDPTIQKALEELRTFFTVDGTKSREYSPRAVWMDKGEDNLSPIPNYVSKENVNMDEMKRAFLNLRSLIFSALDSTDQKGAKAYAKRFQATTHPKDLLDLYETFVARLDPKIQKEYVSNQVRSAGRDFLQGKRDAYQERVDTAAEEGKQLNNFYDVALKIYDTLDTDLAKKMVAKIQKGKESPIIIMRDFESQQKIRDAEKNVSASLFNKINAFAKKTAQIHLDEDQAFQEWKKKLRESIERDKLVSMTEAGMTFKDWQEQLFEGNMADDTFELLSDGDDEFGLENASEAFKDIALDIR